MHHGCVYDGSSKRKQTIAPVVDGSWKFSESVARSDFDEMQSKISNVSLFTALAAIRMCSSVTISIICSRFIQQLYATITYTRFPIFPLLDFALYKNVRLEK